MDGARTLYFGAGSIVKVACGGAQARALFLENGWAVSPRLRLGLSSDARCAGWAVGFGRGFAADLISRKGVGGLRHGLSRALIQGARLRRGLYFSKSGWAGGVGLRPHASSLWWNGADTRPTHWVGCPVVPFQSDEEQPQIPIRLRSSAVADDLRSGQAFDSSSASLRVAQMTEGWGNDFLLSPPPAMPLQECTHATPFIPRC
jgi:hypothetical protein